MSLILPEWVARNERHRARVEAHAQRNGEWRRFNRLLRDIDPRLSCVFIPALEEPVPGVVDWRWHIVRVNESGPDAYWAVLAEDGGYREITDRDIEDFKGRDLWNPAVRREVEQMREKRRRSKDRAKDLRKEQRRDELTSAVNSVIRPSALFSEDVRWVNRSAGKRGRK